MFLFLGFFRSEFFPDTPFDCDSFMLYGTETFSTGKPTMVPVNETSCDLRWSGVRQRVSSFALPGGLVPHSTPPETVQTVPRSGIGRPWGGWPTHSVQKLTQGRKSKSREAIMATIWNQSSVLNPLQLLDQHEPRNWWKRSLKKFARLI